MILRFRHLLMALPVTVAGVSAQVSEAGAGADEPMRLAQRGPWGGNAPGADAPKEEADPPPGDEKGRGRLRRRGEEDKAREAPRPERQEIPRGDPQAREKAVRERQNAGEGRRDRDQARERIPQERQNGLKARQQIEAEQARQKAQQQLDEEKQRAAQQAREKAARDRQDAAERDALKAEQGRKDAIEKLQRTQEKGLRGGDRDRRDVQDRNRFQERKDVQDGKDAQDQKDAADRAQRAREDALRQKKDADDRRRAAPAANAPFRKDPSAGAPARAFDRKAVDTEFERARERARTFDRSGTERDRAPPAADANRAPERGRDMERGRDRERGRDMERWRADSARKFEDIRSKRQERTLFDGRRRDIIEPDNRVIVRQNDRSFIRHDESRRFQRTGREVRRERRKDGLTMIVTMGLAGALIYSLQDDDGRLVRRSRRDRSGREVVLIDNEDYYGRHHGRLGRERFYDSYVELPPPRVTIPREDYIVDYEEASQEDIYDALMAPPVERLERGYSLDEVRHSYSLLERMRRIDLDAINFDFGSWEVGQDQYPKLERIANAMLRVLDRRPEEIFLIEGHTDAVGSDIDNLSLSDRRAETVAVILSDVFDVPPENLTTQGYGEQYLKVATEEPSRINRRVSVRRITPLLSRQDRDGVD